MVKSGGIVSCFRAEEGELLYSERISTAGAYFASPVAATPAIIDNKLYIRTANSLI